jgi:hypothetical protein
MVQPTNTTQGESSSRPLNADSVGLTRVLLAVVKDSVDKPLDDEAADAKMLVRLAAALLPIAEKT